MTIDPQKSVEPTPKFEQIGHVLPIIKKGTKLKSKGHIPSAMSSRI
jgi:hypothetical protein